MSLAYWRIGPETLVATEASAPEPAAALDLLLGRMRMPAAYCPGTTAVVMEILMTPTPEGRSAIRVNGEKILHVENDEVLAPVLEKLINGFLMSANRATMMIHAALVGWNGRHLLLPADPGSGKSTLTAWLCEHGGLYGGDDLIHVDPETGALLPYPKAVTLKAGSFPLFAETTTWQDPARGAIRYLTPASVLMDPVPADKVDAIVLPHHDPKGPATITPLSKEVRALLLLQQTVGGLERDPRNLDTIQRLSDRPGFLLQYRSSEEATKLLGQLQTDPGEIQKEGM